MRHARGLSTLHFLFLMTTVVVVGGWFVTYAQFNERMQMAKTNSHFVAAVNASRDHRGPSLSANQWAGRFNDEVGEAPQGGQAFVVNNAGNESTGAIGVTVDDYGAEVHVIRPGFRTLSPHRAVVRDGAVSYTKIKHDRF